MGQSTNGILWYGYAFTDDTPPWVTTNADYEMSEDPDEGDEEARYLRLSGFDEPRGAPGWYERRRAVLDASPCQVITHCSSEYLMYGVAINGSQATSHRGSPKAVQFAVVPPEWDQQLADYCALMGIDVGDQKPQWWLASWWG